MRRFFLLTLCFLFVFSSLGFSKIVRSCNSFLFLVDESASMKDKYQAKPKIKIEKQVLKKINQGIPNISYTAAMRVFSHKTAYNTASLYPVSDYNKDKMCEAIKKVKAYSEWTSIGYGLNATKEDLKKMNGKIHLILFSDGNEDSTYKSPELVAKMLKQQFPNLCIFAVQIGKSKYGHEVLSKIVNATGCGKVYRAESLNYEINYENFIKDVFGYEVVEAKPVPKPAPKPAPKPVVKEMPKDTDGDGIYDKYDRCPNTPKGAPVDAYGCWEINNIYFDTNKYNIKPKYEFIIKEVAKVLKLNPELKLEIDGYTDNRGSETYNLELSKKRAEAVKKELEKYSICPCRLIVKYFGEKNPVASNATPEGRALNRRVEMKIIR